MSDSGNANAFSVVLNQAINQSGLSLSSIVTFMKNKGHTIALTTLSNWKAGQSLPRRNNSLASLPALEELLYLPAGTLTEALAQATDENQMKTDLEKEAARKPHPIDYTFEKVFSESDTATDWDHKLHREILDEETYISPDFRTQTRKVTFWLRIPDTPDPAYHVSLALDPTDVRPESGFIELYDVEGCTIGDRRVFANGVTTLTRLDLPEWCVPGSLHRISYSYIITSQSPCSRTIQRGFSWPLRYYSHRVIFEGNVPKKIEWILEYTEEKQMQIQQTHLFTPTPVIGKSAQISLENLSGSQGFFDWDYNTL